MLRLSSYIFVLALLVVSTGLISVEADEFTQEDLKKWKNEFMTLVKVGEELFHSPLGKNSVSCDMCHPHAANTHPETYPKFQKQLGKVASLRDMINWCIQNPAEGEPLAMDDVKMYALEAYITWQRRGQPLAPGKH
jgi:cytochrome c